LRAHAIVTSYGRTATYWLAHAFNQHERALCSHGPDLTPSKARTDEGHSDDTGDENLRTLGEFQKLSVDDYFDRMEAAGDFDLYVNVHGYTAASLANRLGANPRRQYRCINVTRPPVHRAASYMDLYRKHIDRGGALKDLLAATFQSRAQLAEDVRLKLSVDVSDGEAYPAFLAITDILQDRYELTQSPVKSVPMERLTVDVEYFSLIWKQLAGGAIDLPGEVHEAAFAGVKLNAMSAARRSEQVFAGWADWMRTLFIGLINDQKLLQAYAELGYDLSYCAAKRS